MPSEAVAYVINGCLRVALEYGFKLFVHFLRTQQCDHSIIDINEIPQSRILLLDPLVPRAGLALRVFEYERRPGLTLGVDFERIFHCFERVLDVFAELFQKIKSQENHRKPQLNQTACMHVRACVCVQTSSSSSPRPFLEQSRSAANAITAPS